MIVFSAFDGYAGGYVALNRAGIPVKKYYAAEVDKRAIEIAVKNHPDIIQLGDITKIKADDIPEEVDLMFGGSPCQGFSQANGTNAMNFEHSESRLFWEFVRLLKELRPKYFMLENVPMKQEWAQIISDALGVDPIMINSALVSAQNRRRLYWTNIPGVSRPKDKKIYLRDIVLKGALVDPLMMTKDKKSFALVATYAKASAQASIDKHLRTMVVDCPLRIANITPGKIGYRVYSLNGKSPAILAKSGGIAGAGNILIDAGECEPKEHSNNSLCQHVANATDIKGNDAIKRVYGVDGKSPTLDTMRGGNRQPKITDEEKLYYRKLLPIECERLQTLPDNYTEGVPNTHRYKMLGNGWTVDVVAHIFSALKMTPEQQIETGLTDKVQNKLL